MELFKIIMQKITLDQIRQFIDPETLLLSSPKGFQTRTKEMDESYRIEKTVILRKWENLEDYCKVVFLEWKYYTVKQSNKNKAFHCFGCKKYNLVLANFPYDLVDCEHYILWFNGYCDEKVAIESAKLELQNLGFDLEKTAIFKNEVKNQSVAGLTHWHFLTQK